MNKPVREHIAFLDRLRGPAALLVVWAHWVGTFPEDRGLTPVFLPWVRRWVNAPLGIIQDFGFLGVCIFFLVSGFVITHVAQTETWREFLLKRIFRIYPLLILTVFLTLILMPAIRAQASLLTFILNTSLLAYFIQPQIIFVGVAWTLVIEIMFYALVLVCYPWRRRPALLLTAELGAIWLLLAVAREFGDSFFLFAASLTYVPYLVVGQIFYFGLYRKILKPGMMVLFLAASLFTIFQGLTHIHTQFLPVSNSYLISFGWAIVIFLGCLIFNQRLPRVGKPLKFLAETSYGLYLLHGVIGAAILEHAMARWGYYPALAAAGLGTLISVYVAYRFFERPVLHMIRSRYDAPRLGS